MQHTAPTVPPLVSVCIITYNHQTYIEQCLLSILEQATDFEFEIVVGEDHSTDGTLAAIRQVAADHPEKIRVLANATNLGLMGNYRLVHGAAQGEFIAHCDGDDYWQPGKLAAQIAFMRAHPTCVGVFTNSLVVSEEGRPSGFFSSNVAELFDTAYLIERGNFLHHSSLLYRSRYRPHVLSPTGSYIDYEVYIKLSKLGPLGYVDAPLTVYRDQSSSSVIRRDADSIRRLYWQALCVAAEGGSTPRALANARAHFLSGVALEAVVRRGTRTYRHWAERVRAQAPSTFATIRRRAWSMAVREIWRRAWRRIGRRLGMSRASKTVFYPR